MYLTLLVFTKMLQLLLRIVDGNVDSITPSHQQNRTNYSLLFGSTMVKQSGAKFRGASSKKGNGQKSSPARRAHRVNTAKNPRRRHAPKRLQKAPPVAGESAASSVATTATTAATTVVQEGGRRIENHEIAKLPSLAWQGPVHVLRERGAVQTVVARLFKHETLLGFDTETKPVFCKGQYEPPALVQLAAAHAVYIFQIKPRGGGGCSCCLDLLLPLFQAAHITKVGVAVAQDVKELQQVINFKAAGFVELAERTRPLGYAQTGLRALTALLLGGNLNKKQQMSNWAKPVLSQAQIQYAATDAWVGRQLYLQILREEKKS